MNKYIGNTNSAVNSEPVLEPMNKTFREQIKGVIWSHESDLSDGYNYYAGGEEGAEKTVSQMADEITSLVERLIGEQEKDESDPTAWPESGSDHVFVRNELRASILAKLKE